MNKSGKKLLWILPYFPYPLLSGGNVRVFNLIKHLGSRIDIDLVSFVDEDPEPEGLKALKSFCNKVITVKRKLYEGDLPLIFQNYYTPEMRSVIKESLKERYDFIQIDYLTMAYYAVMIKELSDAPLFFTEHDVSWMDFDRCFHNRHLDEKQRYCEWAKMLSFIDKLYKHFDVVITVSGNDANILKDRFPGKMIFSAPTGTDCSYYRFKSGRDSSELVYTGHYVHYPNVDSVNFFLEKIFPVIKKEKPDTMFFIVGSAGDKVFKDIKDSAVKVTGTVKDLRTYLYRAGVFVAPVRLGIGIRGKILEAMSSGVPVVTTSAGAKGIGAESGVHLLASDNPGEFASLVVKLLDDKNFAKRIALNARDFVEKNYDWPVRAEELLGIYSKNL